CTLRLRRDHSRSFRRLDSRPTHFTIVTHGCSRVAGSHVAESGHRLRRVECAKPSGTLGTSRPSATTTSYMKYQGTGMRALRRAGVGALVAAVIMVAAA